MIRKLFLIAVLILPLTVFSQQKTTIVISQDHGPTHGKTFQQVFKYLASPFQFVERIFDKKRNYVNTLTFNIDRHQGLSYHIPLIINDEQRILLNNRHVIILPQRIFFLNNDRNGIIIKRNGRTIYIKRDRRS